jgi:chromosome segregation ATPase
MTDKKLTLDYDDKDRIRLLESSNSELRENFKLNILRLAEKESENAELEKEIEELRNCHESELGVCYQYCDRIKELKARWEKLEGQLKRFPFERLTIDAILQTMQELENGGEVHAVSDECRVWDSKENKEIKSLLKSLRKSKPNEYPAPFWAVKLIDRKKTKPSNPKGVK